MLSLYSNRAYAEELHRRIESDNDTTINRDVFDGMRGKLTQAHIDAGVINNCRKCPVALAVSDMLAQHAEQIGHSQMSVEVNRMYVYIFTGIYKQVVIVAEISGFLDEWIKDFDDGKKLPPGEIYIEKDGLIDSIAGGKAQHWSIGIDGIPDAYYIDEWGDDNTVDWGVSQDG